MSALSCVYHNGRPAYVSVLFPCGHSGEHCTACFLSYRGARFREYMCPVCAGMFSQSLLSYS